MEEKEKMDFKKRYILNRLQNVLEEVSVPGYAILECLAISTAAIMIETSKEDLPVEEHYKCVNSYAEIIKALIEKMSKREKVSMADIVKTANELK